MAIFKVAAWFVIMVIGCSKSPDAFPDSGIAHDDTTSSPQSNKTDTDTDTDIATDDAGEPVYDRVYVHSAATLYQVDPVELTLSVVGDFIWPENLPDEQMTDIAIDAHGKMIGVSFINVYEVDNQTAECTFLTELSGGFNGLSFVEGVRESETVSLVGTTMTGSWFTLDQTTGEGTEVGSFGNNMTSSGDVVFVRDAGTFATVKHPDYDTDVLVSVDPSNGEATIIGETGFQDIWGVGYWAGQIYGFTRAGEFILINAMTGVGVLEETTDAEFWGAGVTTLAPVVV